MGRASREIDRDLIREVRALYFDGSKHAVYQTLPRFAVERLGMNFEIEQEWRSDRARYSALTESPGVFAGSVIDIGANVGFFGLSLAYDFSIPVYCFEPNEKYCTLMRKLAKLAPLEHFEVVAQSVTPSSMDMLPQASTALLLNVLHHAGHDFDRERVNTVGDLPAYFEEWAAGLREHVENLVVQVGYNWGGDNRTPIVRVGDRLALCELVGEPFVRQGWEVDRIAFACRRGARVAYEQVVVDSAGQSSLDDVREIVRGRFGTGVAADDWPGEFNKRPLLWFRRT